MKSYLLADPANVMTNCKQLGLLPAPTWNHEVDHQAHGAGEEDDPDDSLHYVAAILSDVLEAVQGSLSKVRLDMFGQREHYSN